LTGAEHVVNFLLPSGELNFLFLCICDGSIAECLTIKDVRQPKMPSPTDCFETEKLSCGKVKFNELLRKKMGGALRVNKAH